jgi:Nucleotidyl transferase of unknown function (DUF2204)
MENRVDAEPIDWLLKPAATEEGEDFRIFTHERRANGRIMQNGDAAVDLKFRQRLLQPNGVIDCLLNELFDERFAPYTQHPATKPTGKTADAGEANACDFDGFAVEHVHTGAVKHFADKLGFAGLKIVVTKHSDTRDAESGTDVGDELLGFFSETVISKIAAKQENVGRARDLLECVVQRSARVLAVMEIGGRGNADFAMSHASKERYGCVELRGRCVWQYVPQPRKIDTGYARIRTSGIVMMLMPDGETAAADFYCDAMRVLERAGLEFLVGGAYAFAFYTGISRDTRDFDLFLRPADVDPALGAFQRAGYEADKTYPHWLAKVKAGDDFIDLIFRAGNGLCSVDDLWFTRAARAELLGLRVRLCPPEEILWMKAFIMERERYDGADLAHLFQSCAERIDWQHLLDRFGPDWEVLLNHLVLFGYVYPSERSRIPEHVMEELVHRLRNEQPLSERICRGTLLSRAQYLIDVKERGFRDARLDSRVQMGLLEISDWTNAIGD